MESPDLLEIEASQSGDMPKTIFHTVTAALADKITEIRDTAYALVVLDGTIIGTCFTLLLSRAAYNRKDLDINQLAEATRLYTQERMSATAIIEALGLSGIMNDRTLIRNLRDNDVEIRPKGGMKLDLLKHPQGPQIIAQYQAGIGCNTLVKSFNLEVSDSGLLNALKRAKVSIRPSRSGRSGNSS